MKCFSFILIVWMASCISRNTNSTSLKVDTTTKKKDTIKANSSLQIQNLDFSEFWSEFRQVVLGSDSNKLITLTHFPIIVHGDQDQDPQLKISKAEFVTFFKKFLQRTSFVKGESLTNFDFIKKTQVADKSFGYQETDIWKRVGDLEFEKVNNNWMLTLIYYPTAK